MGSDKYEIWCDETLIASNMSLWDALLLCKAEFDEYCILYLTIKRMKKTELGEE